MLLASGGGACAGEYHPGEFLNLDLPSAALSPKPLGPSSEFTPGTSDVAVDPAGEVAKAGNKASNEKGTEASTEPKTSASKTVASRAEPNIVIHRTRVAHLRMEKPRGVARTKVARRHTSPLDAQAFDTRIQVWPCRTGGICDWKR
jgi:hypothetical protein